MASRKRKRKEEQSAWLTMIAIIVVVAAIAFPIYLIYSYFNAKKNTKLLPSLKRNPSDFWLSNKEKQTFIHLYQQKKQYATSIKSAHNLALQHNISINKDGNYSIRSKVGKQVRQLLDELTPLHEKTASELADLAELPQNRWQQFDQNIRNLFACKLGIIVWTLTLMCMLIYARLHPTTPNDSNSPFSTQIFPAIIGASIISGIIYAILYFGQQGAKKFSPKPPIVNAENYNKF